MTRFVWIAGGLAVVAPASPAMADEPFQFLKITCAPELHYFSVQRVLVYNLPENGPYRDRHWRASSASSARLADQRGLFDSAVLSSKPYVCEIPRFPSVKGRDGRGRPAISVTVRSARISDGRKMISLGPKGVFEIIANGKSLGVIDLGTDHVASDLTGIEVKADGVGIDVRSCRAKDYYGEGAIAPDETKCTHTGSADGG